MKITFIPVCAFITFVAVHPAFAEGKAKGHKEAKPVVVAVAVKVAPAAAKPRAVVKASPPKQPWVGHNVTISESERHVIRAYVRDCVNASKGGKFNGVPQGLVKKVTWGWGSLPSDWQKNCARGGVLPADLHRHCHSLPDDVIVKLPPPPPGTVLLAVNGRVVRVAYPTYEILDVFDVL